MISPVGYVAYAACGLMSLVMFLTIGSMGHAFRHGRRLRAAPKLILLGLWEISVAGVLAALGSWINVIALVGMGVLCMMAARWVPSDEQRNARRSSK